MNKNTENKKWGILLFIVAKISCLLFCWIGYLWAIIKCVTRFKFYELSCYFYDCALSEDQSANVKLRYPCNKLFITKEGYKFGNPDETLSGVFGKNKSKKTLLKDGIKIADRLNAIDENHVEKSIEEDENYN